MVEIFEVERDCWLCAHNDQRRSGQTFVHRLIISISCDSQMSLRPSPALFASSSLLLKCLRLLALVQHNCRDMRTLHSSAMCFSGHSKWSKIRHKKGKPLSLAPTNAL